MATQMSTQSNMSTQDMSVPYPGTKSTVIPTSPLSSAPTQPVSPAVITSQPAKQNIQQLKTGYADASQSIANQQAKLAQIQSNAQLEAQRKAEQDAQAQAASQKQKELEAKQAAIYGTPETITQQWTGKTVYNPLTGKMDVVNNIGKSGDQYLVSFASDPNQKYVSSQDLAKFTYTPEQGKQDYAQMQLDKLNAEYDAKSQEVTNTINNIQNGTVPLNQGQLAQIDALKKQYEQMINQQKLINTTSSGIANVRGYQTGAAEYDPMFQVKTIGSIISAGEQKVAQLNSEMAAAVAQMTTGFQNNNIEAVKSAWNIYSNSVDKRQKYLQDVVDNTQKAIKQAQDAQVKQQELYYNEVTKPIEELAKTASTMGADSGTVSKILASRNLSDAYDAAGAFSSGGTGIIGEYNYYKNQAKEAGVPYVDFNTYQTLDANRKAKVAGGVTAGSPTSYKEWELAGKPGTYERWLEKTSTKAPTVAQQTVAEYAARIEQSTPTIDKLENEIVKMSYPVFAAQINLPAAFQSATIQQYMQAARNFINAKLRRESGAVISPTEFSEARAQYLPQPGDSPEALQLKKDNRDLVFSSLKKAAGPAYYSVEELLGTGGDLIKTEQQAQSNLQSYIANNPTKSAEIDSHIKTMEKTLGRPISAVEFYQAFPEYK